MKMLFFHKKYKDVYDGINKTGPARNFAWDKSIELGFTHHWVMDDNLDAFRQ